MLIFAVTGLAWQGLLAVQTNQQAAGRGEESCSLDKVGSAPIRAARATAVVIATTNDTLLTKRLDKVGSAQIRVDTL